ncbi:hypothetical protein KY290_028081 [Solanum tuberosum]|uniref:Uncharacterized protein n=1 Tax=Solanum tuberosum TaxID=4113 RepID=A0ABQ7UHC2_SOLTU|nr:hypothetical protein KY290_028081 [Solanum tuberosum]
MERQKLMQFLMGLNDNFAQSRSQILLTVPSPSLNQAYSMIMQDESQRIQFSLISNCVLPLQKLDINEPTALSSTHNNRFNQSTSQNTRLYYDYCHLRNHTKANCYKLIGYPQHYKFTKKKGTDDRSNKGQISGNDRSQVFGGNRKPQINNAQYAENLDINRNTDVNLSSLQTVPTFTFD